MDTSAQSQQQLCHGDGGGKASNSVTSFRWKIIGIVGVTLIAFTFFGCGLFSSWPLRACVRSALHGLASEAFLLLSMFTGGWVGWETGTATKRPWVGWIVGIAAAIALGFFFTWLGFEPHASERYE